MKNLVGMFFYLLISIFILNFHAYANSYNIFGADSRATAMGNAYTTLATDPAGLYYNPACIVFNPSVTTLEFAYYYPVIDLDFKGESLSSQIYLDEAENVDRPYGFSIGATTKVATLLGNDLSFGVLVYITRKNLISEKFRPENEPISFQFYDQPLTDIILAGLGYKVNRFLSLGFALSILSDLKTDIKTDVLGNPFYAKSEGILPLTLSPYFGLFFIEKRYRVGISYRGQKGVHLTSKIDDKLSGVVTQEATLVESPAQITIGASGNPFDNITLSADLSFVDWSHYTPPWITVKPAGGGIAGSQIVPLIAEKAGLRDTILPKFGIEYLMSDNTVALRAGYIFRQSPVPDQTEKSNLIDSDTHIFSIGTGYSINIKNVKKAIEIDFHFQYHLMTERKTEKFDKANPAYPGYTAKGNVYNTGITIKFNFVAPEKISNQNGDLELES